jgi:predicted GIY-YIG superfamily endonuclease
MTWRPDFKRIWKARAPNIVKILAQKSFANRSEASVAEAQLKKLPKSQKLAFFD